MNKQGSPLQVASSSEHASSKKYLDGMVEWAVLFLHWTSVVSFTSKGLNCEVDAASAPSFSMGWTMIEVYYSIEGSPLAPERKQQILKLREMHGTPRSPLRSVGCCSHSSD